MPDTSDDDGTFPALWFGGLILLGAGIVYTILGPDPRHEWGWTINLGLIVVGAALIVISKMIKET